MEGYARSLAVLATRALVSAAFVHFAGIRRPTNAPIFTPDTHHASLRPPPAQFAATTAQPRRPGIVHTRMQRASQRSHRARLSPGSSPQVYHDAVRRAAPAHQVLRLAQPRVAAHQPVDGGGDRGGRDCRAADLCRQDQRRGRHRAGPSASHSAPPPPPSAPPPPASAPQCRQHLSAPPPPPSALPPCATEQASQPASQPASHCTLRATTHGPHGRPYSREPGYGGYLWTLRPTPAPLQP